MNFDNQYVEQLEQLITETLVPKYNDYYTLTGERKPELNQLIISLIQKRKLCALVKPKKHTWMVCLNL